MNTQFNSNVIWLQLEYKISTLEGEVIPEVASFKKEGLVTPEG